MDLSTHQESKKIGVSVEEKNLFVFEDVQSYRFIQYRRDLPRSFSGPSDSQKML
jgi:hypothetical protein